MKLSNYFLDFLVSEGVKHIFEVCGGSLAHLLDSMYERIDIMAVSMHHEMAASIAAEGYARAGQRLGVAMATSGPGATNMVTGIGSCFFDSIPSLFITGQVNTYEFKFDLPVRQAGFQETDIVSIVRPITKKAMLVEDERKIRYCLEEAVYLARNGRPGPVLLDLPLNVQRAVIDHSSLAAYRARPDSIEHELSSRAEEVRALIESSVRPIILAGGGVRLSGATRELSHLAECTGIPVVTSLMGLDAFPHDNPLFMGMIGTYGNRYANLAIANSDLILALGSRLDTRQTGTRPETFARGAKLVHVEIDLAELNAKIEADCAVNGDIKEFLTHLNQMDFQGCRERIEPWRARVEKYRAQYPSFREPCGEKIDPNHFMHQISSFIPEDAIISADVGQIQMWSAQTIRIRKGQRFLTQGGMASMGSALPMAIGASFARPGSIILVISGDGGFQLNIQELQTVYHHNLPIKMVLLNNHCYGMVRQFQEQYFQSRFQSTVVGYSAPDFQDVVSAYKIKARKVTASSEVPAALSWLFGDACPAFLEVDIDSRSNVTPKLSVNKPVEDQEPALPREELRLNMILDILPEQEGS